MEKIIKINPEELAKIIENKAVKSDSDISEILIEVNKWIKKNQDIYVEYIKKGESPKGCEGILRSAYGHEIHIDETDNPYVPTDISISDIYYIGTIDPEKTEEENIFDGCIYIEDDTYNAVHGKNKSIHL